MALNANSCLADKTAPAGEIPAGAVSVRSTPLGVQAGLLN